MMKDQPSKRVRRAWYLLPVKPMCPRCNIPCLVQHTSTDAQGRRIQHRYCPHCGTPNKTIYTP